VGKLQYLMGQKKISILDTRYSDKVEMEIMAPAGESDRLIKDITEVTSGQALITEGNRVWYGVVEGEVVLM